MTAVLRSQLESGLTYTTAPPPANDDETALIREAVRSARSARPNEAFAELYRRYVDRVYRYLLIRIGNAQDAQDITSQTFLSALQGISHYRSRSSFPGWLLGIARHKVADHFRCHPAMLPLESAVHLPHTEHGPDDLIDGKLTVERVASVLRILAPDRAEAVALHIFGGLDIKEIAQAMGKRPSAAKMLVHRGLHDLRQRIQVEE